MFLNMKFPNIIFMSLNTAFYTNPPDLSLRFCGMWWTIRSDTQEQHSEVVMLRVIGACQHECVCVNDRRVKVQV